MACHEAAGSGFGHWLKNTSTAHKEGVSGKDPAATDTSKAVWPKVATKRADRLTCLSEVRTTVDQAILESKKKSGF